VSSTDNKPLTMQPGTWSRDGNIGWVSKQIVSQKSPKPEYQFVAVESWTQNNWGRLTSSRVLGAPPRYFGRFLSFFHPVE
jgi:hypothetical protein